MSETETAADAVADVPDPNKPRRRGRKGGEETAAATAEAPPASPTIEIADETVKPKRGRPPKIDPAQSYAQQAIEAHKFMAALFGAPFLELEPGEAARIGSNMANVAEEFGWEHGGKIGAVLGLVLALGAAELPRLAMLRAYAAHKAAEAKRLAQVQRQAQQEGNGEGS